MRQRLQDVAETTAVDIPMPIVNLNRWTLVGGVLAGLLLRQPLVTTSLFAILLPAALFGQRASLIFRTGKWLLASWIDGAEREDKRLQRFNNTIAVTLLGGAQVAFALGQPLVGWALSLAVALAAGVALMAFSASGRLVVITSAKGSRCRRRAYWAPLASRGWPLLATMTGSTTRCGRRCSRKI